MSQPLLQDLNTALALAHQNWNAGNAAQAERLCRNILSVWPGQEDALHLLGLMAHAYGNVDQAIDYVREACRAPTAPALFFCNLAEMCRRRGLLAEGIRAGRQAVNLAPHEPDGWNNLGILQQEAGQIQDSIDSLKRALMLRPNDPLILNNLGNSSRLAGQLADAEGYYLRACEQAPDYAQPHNNLAALAAMRGDFDAGVAHARAALECEPQFAEAYLNLADIESARGNQGEALRWLDALQAFAPDHVGALCARSLLLLQTGQLRAASDSAGRAVIVSPQNGMAHLRLGDALALQGQREEALAAYRQALALPGLHIEQTWLNLSALLSQAGRLDEAQAVLAEARRQLPDSVPLLLAHADSTLADLAPGDLARLETLAAHPEQLNVAMQLGVHFTLGNALLGMGETTRALTQLEQGNRLKRASIRYDATAVAQWMADIASVFPTELQSMPGVSDTSRIVFIIGMPGAGSSLVEQLLTLHPHVTSVGESPALRLAVERAGDYPGTLPGWSEDLWRTIGHDYLAACQSFGGGKHWLLDAMPGNFIYAGIIARALPGARIIHCVRDPLDSCMACYRQLFANQHPYCYDLRELGLFFRAYHHLMAHWRRVLPVGSLIEVSYQALCDQPELERQRLLTALNLAPASIPQQILPIAQPNAQRWRDFGAQLAPLFDALGEVLS